LTEDEILGFCEIQEPCSDVLSVPGASGCVNEPIEFLFSLENEDSEILTYLWEFEDGATSNASNLTLTYPDEITQDYTLTVTTEYNCVYTTTGTMTVETPLGSFMQNEFNICGSDLIDLDFSDLPFNVVDSDGELVESVQISVAGTYIFTGQNACSSFEEGVIISMTAFYPAPFGDFQFLCQGQDTLPIGFNSDDYNYLWGSGAQDSIILVSEQGQYEVLVTDTTGVCAESFVFMISELPFAPSEIFDFPTVDICLEGQTNINFPPQFGPYTFSDTLTDLTYTAIETETLSFTYSDGCFTYQDTLFISVESCLCPVWVPNVFAPNEDGLNDLFKPVLDCNIYD
jgi:PKD repeat protein